MAEQLIDRRIISPPAGFPVAPAESASHSAATLGASSDALRQAKTCLDSAGRRLRKGEPGHADEVLHLLQSATVHLRQAMNSSTEV